MEEEIFEKFANAKVKVKLWKPYPKGDADAITVVCHGAIDNNWCHPWQGAKNSAGYGIIRSKTGKAYRAHRVAWEFHYGSIPSGQLVLHDCDNPACVNPSHLHLGTHADNVKDKVSRNRQAKGEKNGQAKLSPETIEEIRRLYVPTDKYKCGDPTRRHTGSIGDLARRFGLDRRHVSKIVNKQRWRHM